MCDQRKLIYTAENRLVTLKCKRAQHGNDVPPVYLICIVETVKVKEKTEGWILIISANPIIPHGKNGRFPNRIHIDKLKVTPEQKATILQGAIVPDEFVYLYAGNFVFGKNNNASESHHEEDLDILKLLSYYLDIYQVKIDLESTVPIKEGLLNLIIHIGDALNESCRKKRDIWRNVVPLERKRLGESELAEVLTVRNTDEYIFVDFERPAIHSGYEVDVTFFQSFDCESTLAHNPQRRRITRRLEKWSIVIPPSNSKKGKKKLSEHERKCSASSHRSPPEAPVKTTVKVLEIPTSDNFINCKVLNAFTVRKVDYCAVARLTKKGKWCGMTKAVMFTRDVKGNEEEETEEITAVAETLSPTQHSPTPCHSNTKNEFPRPLESSSSSSSAPYDIPVKLVIFEILLISPNNAKETTPITRFWIRY